MTTKIRVGIVGSRKYTNKKKVKDLIFKNTQPIRAKEDNDEEKEQSSALGSLGLKPKPAV